MESCKYLATIVDSKLDRTANVDSCSKKATQRLHFLRKLRSFRVNENILLLFYQSVVRNVLLYNQVCYYNNVKTAGAEKLERVIGTAQVIRHHHLESPTMIYETTSVRKLRRIVADSNHLLHPLLSQYAPSRESSGRRICLKSRSNRLGNPFVPTAIHRYSQLMPV